MEWSQLKYFRHTYYESFDQNLSARAEATLGSRTRWRQRPGVNTSESCRHVIEWMASSGLMLFDWQKPCDAYDPTAVCSLAISNFCRWWSWVDKARPLDYFLLTYWGWVTRTCDKSLVNIALDNGLAPNGRQAIIKNDVDLSHLRHLGTYFNQI